MGRLRIVLIALLFLVGQRPALACSCAQSTPVQHAERAVAVFTGTVTAVTRSLAGMTCSPSDPVTVAFAVDTVYKGDVPKDFAVQTAGAGASCGYSFVAGKRYTVFVIRLSGELETNSCVGNVEGAIAPADYGLAQGRPPRS